MQIFKRFTFHTASISIFKNLKLKLHFKYVLFLLARTLTLQMQNLPPSLSYMPQNRRLCRYCVDPLFSYICAMKQVSAGILKIHFSKCSASSLFPITLIHRSSCGLISYIVALYFHAFKTCLLLNYKPTGWSSTFPADVLANKVDKLFVIYGWIFAL